MNPPFCHLVITNGFRTASEQPSQFLKEKAGIDTIVYDLGYIRRSDSGNREGYYQMGLNRLGWITDLECPSDRFDNLGVDIVPVVDNHKPHVLICAQKYNDAQHKMNEIQMYKAMKWECDYYSALGFDVIFRPHPKSKFHIKGYDTPEENLQASLDRCRFVVTYNSTVGVDALLAGIPLVAIAEDVHYKPVTSKLVEDGEGGFNLSLPTRSQLESYFHRLAYSQWMLEEVKAGYPFRFLLAIIDGQDPFDLGWQYTALQPVSRTALPTLSVDGMGWTQARVHVKAMTGESPKSKAHLAILVEEYNAKA